MKKRITIVLALAMISVIMVASFAGCSQKLTEKEGMEYLNKCIENTTKADMYYIKYINVKSAKSSSEIRLNVFADNKKTDKKDEYGIQIQTFKDAKIETSTIYGNSLKKGVKEKKATDKDWKKGVMFVSKKNADGKLVFDVKNPVAMTEELFLANENLLTDKNNPKSVISMKNIMMGLELFVNGDKKPNSITRTGHITEYVYNDITKDVAVALFGMDKDAKAERYPLTIQTVNDKISQVVIEPVIKNDITNQDSPKYIVKYYITMQGPNVNVPNWE